MISGIVTAILLAAFVAITAWAWSSRQRARFDEASRLPLMDEVSNDECRVTNERHSCRCQAHSTLDIRHSTVP